MTREEYIDSERAKLINFCKEHRHIYLYGAGRYGEEYLDVLRQMGTTASGFITSKNEKQKFCELPVYCVKEICESITKDDGIIPAYQGSTIEDIKKMFGLNKPDVLSFDHQVMVSMGYEIHFLPIIEKLKEEFPLPIPRKKCLNWKNLLVIRLDVIGDVVCTTAFIRELKRNYPEGKVTVVIRKQNELLLKNCPYIDRLVLYESDLVNIGIIEESNSFDSLRRKVSAFMAGNFADTHFDVVFLPKEVLYGGKKIEELLMAVYSKADRRVGRLVDSSIIQKCIYPMVKDMFSNIYYQTEPMHESMFQLEMLKNLGLEVKDDKLELWLNDRNRIQAEIVLKENGIDDKDKLIALGVVGRVPVKNWSVEKYKELINQFYKKYGTEFKFIIFGGKDAVESAKQLTENIEIVINLTGKLELDVTAACIEQCELYVGSNTGLLHIASALGKPSVTMYMALDDSPDICAAGPCRWGSRIKNSIELLPQSGLDGCHESCKKKYPHCINQITPYQVEQAIESILNINEQGEG